MNEIKVSIPLPENRITSCFLLTTSSLRITDEAHSTFLTDKNATFRGLCTTRHWFLLIALADTLGTDLKRTGNLKWVEERFR